MGEILIVVEGSFPGYAELMHAVDDKHEPQPGSHRGRRLASVTNLPRETEASPPQAVPRDIPDAGDLRRAGLRDRIPGLGFDAAATFPTKSSMTCCESS